MKNFLTLALFFVGIAINAQVDKIYKHNGDVVEGKVIKLEEFTIIFKI
jgi:hypothetical protein